MMWVIVGLLVVAVVLILILSGGSDTQDDQRATTTDDTMTEETTTNQDVARVQAALSGQGSVQCTYNIDDQGATSYIQDGRIRVIAEAEGQTTNMIYAEDSIYLWQQGETNGFVFSPDEFSTSQNLDPVPVRPNDVEESVRSDNVSCEESDVDDQLLVVPNDINFQSFSQSSVGASSGGDDVPMREN